MPDEPRDRGLHRHDNPPQGEEQKAVTGRPNDLGHVDHEPALANSTLASRAKANTKAIDSDDDVEDKAVKKAPATKAARKRA